MLLSEIMHGKKPDYDEAYELFSILVSEDDTRIAAYLTSMEVIGYTPEMVAGFAAAMRDNSVKLRLGSVADTAGTGGDRSNTINVSTAASLILSSFTGVAKHGNRSVTSRSGSADILEKMGIDPLLKPADALSLYRKTGFTFLYAPLYHPSLKNIMQIRRKLGFRTIFNLLGPLSNPAAPTQQMIGVSSLEMLDVIAHALPYLEVKHALVVYGNGIDEVNPQGPTEIAEIEGHDIRKYALDPRDIGLERSGIKVCKGPDESAKRVMDVFAGGGSIEDRNFIVLNAAVALYAADICDLPECPAEVVEILGEPMLEHMEEIKCFFH